MRNLHIKLLIGIMSLLAIALLFVVAPPILAKSSGEEHSASLDDTCTCDSGTSSYCHYEYIPSFKCTMYKHEHDTDTPEYIVDYDDADDDWGMQYIYVGTTYDLLLSCPIPTDRGLGSIKNYNNVSRVDAYFYHDIEDFSTIGLYTANVSGDSELHGSDSDTSAGQVTLFVEEDPAKAKYINWHLLVIVADVEDNAFHGYRICYDPD